MARININSNALTYDQLKEEIDLWANSEETRNLAFINEICQAFQNRAEEYYKAGATIEDRSQRLEEIRQALIEIGFTDGERTFTIAADSNICPNGNPPKGGVCR